MKIWVKNREVDKAYVCKYVTTVCVIKYNNMIISTLLAFDLNFRDLSESRTKILRNSCNKETIKSERNHECIYLKTSSS